MSGSGLVVDLLVFVGDVGVVDGEGCCCVGFVEFDYVVVEVYGGVLLVGDFVLWLELLDGGGFGVEGN